MIFQRRHYPHQIFCSNGRPVEFYKTSSSKTILLDVQQTYYSANSVAMEAHVLTHNPPNHLQVVPRHYHGDRSKLLYSRGYFYATGRLVEIRTRQTRHFFKKLIRPKNLKKSEKYNICLQ